MQSQVKEVGMDTGATGVGTANGNVDSPNLTVLIKQLECLTNEIILLRKDFNVIDKKINDNFKKVNDDIIGMKKENKKLRGEIVSLKQQLNTTEQFVRYNGIKINNVPHQENEQVMAIVKQISEAIDFNFDEFKIDSCYRIKSKLPNGPIIVKFIRNLDKLEFLRLKRVKKDILNTDLLHLAPSQPIYISEFLSPHNAWLFKQLKSIQHKCKLNYIWTKNNLIMARENDQSPVMFIRSVDDIHRFLSKHSEVLSEIDYSGDDRGIETDTSEASKKSGSIVKKRKVKTTSSTLQSSLRSFLKK